MLPLYCPKKYTGCACGLSPWLLLLNGIPLLLRSMFFSACVMSSFILPFSLLKVPLSCLFPSRTLSTYPCSTCVSLFLRILTPDATVNSLYPFFLTVLLFLPIVFYSLICSNLYMVDVTFWIKVGLVALLVILVFLFYYADTQKLRRKYLKSFKGKFLFLILLPLVILGIILFSTFFIVLVVGFFLFLLIFWIIFRIFGKRV